MMNIKSQTNHKCPINHVIPTEQVVVLSVSCATYSYNTGLYYKLDVVWMSWTITDWCF